MEQSEKPGVITQPDLSEFRSVRISISREALERLLNQNREQKEALQKVIKAAEAVCEIIGPYEIEKLNKISLVMKLPGIIEDFKVKKDKFLDVLNEQFLQKLKTLTNEIPRN